MNIVRIILTALVALTFIFFSIVKIAGVPEGIFKEQKENYFDNYGISRNGIRLIGIIELLAALLSLAGLSGDLMQVGQVGHIVLMSVTAGAMYFHNRYDSLAKDGFPAIIQFVLNTALLGLTFVIGG